MLKYVAEYPELCRQTNDDEQGGLTFESDRRCFFIRLTVPYSDEGRQLASELAEKDELKGKVKNLVKTATRRSLIAPTGGRTLYLVCEITKAGIIMLYNFEKIISRSSSQVGIVSKTWLSIASNMICSFSFRRL